MEEKIRRHIRDFVKDYTRDNNTKTDWNEPLVSFANADDPLFLKLREVVSETHKMPGDLLKCARTVICYFIPFRKETVLSNVGGNSCSKEWAVAYVETNRLITDLNKSLQDELKKSGFKSVILPPTHNFDEEKLTSDWSHKHVAYISGLGKFGLHKMLITESGCCGRLGSTITTAEISPTKRPDKEFCLYEHNRTCRKCVDNCTFGALKEDSFDRHKCYEICLSNDRLRSDLGLTDVCGKCISVVPCSFQNPVK